jgi:predicted cobalt transporter CbtA
LPADPSGGYAGGKPTGSIAMRIVVLALTFALVLLPTLLILFAPQKPLRARVIWGLASFLSPLLTFAIVRIVPLLSNNTADAAQWERFFGLLLTGSGFFLPWLLFAVFLHREGAR